MNSTVTNACRERLLVLSVAVALLAFPASPAAAQKQDIEILKTSLKKALGEQANTGHYRIVLIKKGMINNQPALSIALNANSSPTPAGLRYGIFGDVVKTFRVLKSWAWPGKVRYVMLGEYARVDTGSGKQELHLVFAGLISSHKISETDWDSFDPRKIPEILDSAQLHELIGQGP